MTTITTTLSANIPPDYQGQFQDWFMREARAHGLDWCVLAAQASYETGHTFNPNMEGDFDENGQPQALGLGQFWKAAWNEVWGDYAEMVPWEACAKSPEFAIPAQAMYMQRLTRIVKEASPRGTPKAARLRLAIGAYNWGIGNVSRLLRTYDQWSDEIWQHFPQSTRAYIDGIMTLAERIRQNDTDKHVCQE